MIRHTKEIASESSRAVSIEFQSFPPTVNDPDESIRHFGDAIEAVEGKQAPSLQAFFYWLPMS
jgi:hypothetical protein